MRVVCWVLYQQWEALGIAEIDDTTLCVSCVAGFSAGVDGTKRIPRLNRPTVFRLTDAEVRRAFGDAEVDAPGARHRIKYLAPPLCETMRADLAVISATMRAESGMLSAPCAHWLAVFENVVAAQAQSFPECNVRLKVEVARHRAWEAFMGGHGDRRMPLLDALESDETTWRDANWIDHPQFIAWYTAEFGNSPLEDLAQRSLLDCRPDYAMNLQRLKSWVAASPNERRDAINLARF